MSTAYQSNAIDLSASLHRPTLAAWAVGVVDIRARHRPFDNGIIRAVADVRCRPRRPSLATLVLAERALPILGIDVARLGIQNHGAGLVDNRHVGVALGAKRLRDLASVLGRCINAAQLIRL